LFDRCSGEKNWRWIYELFYPGLSYTLASVHHFLRTARLPSGTWKRAGSYTSGRDYQR
jgi:hypothetical protein